MFAQVFFFLPDQASTVAEDVDGLAMFLLVVSSILTILIAFLILYFGIKYRQATGRKAAVDKEGFLKLEIAWSVAPLIVGLIMFAWGAKIFMDLRTPPQDAVEVYVVGKQWMWKLQHPGGQREINELHIPVGQAVKLRMISEDVIHSFYIPAFRVKQDVLPGRYTTMWFEATRPGTYHLFCAEYCGTEHSRMVGKVVVMEPAEYQVWLTQQADGSAAKEGHQLFLKLNCISCHNTSQQSYAPLLENIAGKPVRLTDGSTVIADRPYLRESILNPEAKIVAGYQNKMPSYTGKVSEDDLLKLITFIESLKTGDTPPRVEDTPPGFLPEKKQD